jgi:hypothetical protein
MMVSKPTKGEPFTGGATASFSGVRIVGDVGVAMVTEY